MARNLRNLKVSKGQRIEKQLVMERMGEHSLRNIEVMIRALIFKGTTEKAAVFEGLEVVSAGGMVVNASIPGSCVQRLDDDDLKFGFDDRSSYSLTLDTGGASNRRDIIEAQISRRECFLDGNVDTIDSETKVITTGTRNRDYEIIIDCRVLKGSSTTPPVSSSGTHGTLTGTVEHGSTLDMSEDYMLSFAVFEGEFTTLDFRGSTPNATTRAEIVSRFAEVGITASFDASGHLIIEETSLTGENSCFRIKDSRSSHDVFIALFGGSPLANYHNVYRGENPWFKIAEIDVNSGVSSVSDSNIRPLSERESWVTESDTVFLTTQIMKYVTDKIDEAITGLVGGAPEALDTLNELAAALADDENYASTITAALSERYTKTEMQESGDSSMHWDNITNKPSSYAPASHSAASHSDITGWADSNPLMDGVVSQGSSNKIAREDHRHPADTTKANDSEVVKKTGTQTITGAKTFSAIPILPASNPSSVNQAARAGYVDSQAKNLSHPVRSYYVQYPANASNTESTAFPVAERPATLFGGTWDEIWDTEGVFFRTEGGNAPNLRTNGKQGSAMWGHHHNLGDDNGNVSKTRGRTIGGDQNGVEGSSPACYEVEYALDPLSDGTHDAPTLANESRGVNRLFKIWKRTA